MNEPGQRALLCEAIPHTERNLSPGYQPAVIEELDQQFANQGIMIDADTAVTRWTGEPLDDSAAVARLIRLDQRSPDSR